MNNAMKSAIETAKKNNTEENIKALSDLAVYKFKKVYGRVQDAARTVNRHLGAYDGTPNRAKIATAIGLASEISAYKEVANIIGMKKMEDACYALENVIGLIGEMRKNRTYEQIDFLPDFLTDEEEKAVAVEKARLYLANITDAVNTAIDTINRHIADGSFDVNTFKIAKAIGYTDDIPNLRADFASLIAEGVSYDTEFGQLDDIVRAIADINKSISLQNRLGIKKLNVYDPFPNEGVDGGENADEESLD